MTQTNYLAVSSLLAAAFLAFVASALPSSAALDVSSKSPRQGDTLEVTLVDSSPADGSPQKSVDIKETQGERSTSDERHLTFNGHSYKFFQVAGRKDAAAAQSDQSDRSDNGPSTTLSRWQALIAVPADLDPGKYDLQSDGDRVTLTVRAGLFPLQHIILPPSKNNFDTAPGEEEAVDGAKKICSSNRFFSGPFSLPSKARRSTGFGLKRVVNGKLLKDYFHSGLDFAGALGSPITACSSGKVVLVGRGFKLHGNTVAIDHGQGVVSFYIHMQTITVKNGEAVKQGQQIGTVGQTGRATGPHLHFSIYVNQVAANPNNWFSTSF